MKYSPTKKKGMFTTNMAKRVSKKAAAVVAWMTSSAKCLEAVVGDKSLVQKK
jgi:hypothetical protein